MSGFYKIISLKYPKLLLNVLFLSWLSFSHGLFAGATFQENSFSFSDEEPNSRRSRTPNFKISVGTNLVITDVAVIGKNLPEMKEEDFLIYDNKVAQEVAFFSRHQSPIAVALLVDHSGSVSSIFPLLQLSSLLSLKNLMPEDQVALFKFTNSCRMVVDLTADRLAIGEKITKIKPGGGTQVFYALRKTARYLREKAPDRRRAIILVSDNCDAGPSSDVGKAMEEVLESSVSLYNIRVGGTLGEEYACERQNDQLRNIIDKSGGGQYILGDETSLQSALKDVIASLRNRYTLGFYPSSLGESGSYHELDVKLKERERFPQCRVESRKGYYTGIPYPVSEDFIKEPPTTGTPDENADQLLIQRAILTAGTIRMDIPDIAVTVETVEETELDGNPQLGVYLTIHPDGIGFKEIDGQYLGTQHISIFYADKNGKIQGYDWKTLKQELNPEQYDQVIEDGIRYYTVIPVESKKRILNVVVYDEVRNQIGSKIVELP